MHITETGLLQTVRHLSQEPSAEPANAGGLKNGASASLEPNIRIAKQGKRNANDGIFYLQAADSALGEVSDLLNRAMGVVEQARKALASDLDPMETETELQRLLSSIRRVIGTSTFHGTTIFVASSQTPESGSVFLRPAFSTNQDSTTPLLRLPPESLELSTPHGIATASQTLAVTLVSLRSMRETLGFSVRQLASVSDFLGVQAENLSAAFHQARDADYTEEIVNLTKFQILSQTGIATLSPANQASQQILALLR
jgi:flagellin